MGTTFQVASIFTPVELTLQVAPTRKLVLFLGKVGNGYVARLHPDRSAQERKVAFAFLNF